MKAKIISNELRISVITTKRAYEELELDGFIVSITGKGSFVAGKNLELVREEYLKEIEVHMTKIVELSETCNLSKQQLIEMFEIMYEKYT